MGLYTIHFPLSTILAASHKFCYLGFFFLIHLTFFVIFLVISSFSYWLLRSALFNFHIVVNVSNFLPLLLSNVVLLCLEDILSMTSILLSLLRFVL